MMQRFGVQLRAEMSKGNKLVGHASVFDQVADLGQGQYERMAPTAFKRSLDDPNTDVRALFNHDPNQLLGRQASGTLKLGVDSEGLEFEVDLPDTQLGRDVRVLAERGDLTGASFAFLPGEHQIDRIEGKQVRTHTEVARLIDVSPVTFPAYEGAAVEMRSMILGQPESARSRMIRARARVLLGGK